MSTDTVTIGCRLPNGIVLEVGLQTTVKDANGNLRTQVQRTQNYKRIHIKGTHEHNAPARRAGIQVPSMRGPEPFYTTVPKDFWEQWNKEHPRSWFLSSGNLFVATDKSAPGIAAAAVDAKSKGPEVLQPIDASKPLKVGGDAIETADFQPKAVAKAE